MTHMYKLTKGHEPGRYGTGEGPMVLTAKGNRLTETQAAPLVAAKVLSRERAPKPGGSK